MWRNGWNTIGSPQNLQEIEKKFKAAKEKSFLAVISSLAG
jgi:hypothetical protein